MRTPKTIAAAIWDKIPNDKHKFRRDMLALVNMNNSEYAPPEGIVTWDEIHTALIENIAIPTEDFEFDILSIFTAMPVSELRAIKWELP